jgi:hypothetical protein
MQNGGISFEKPQKIQLKQNTDYKLLTTTITQERIKVLNKKLKYKIKLEIFDFKNDQGDATGTTVVFSIPF